MLQNLNYHGLLLGVIAFINIGVFHPVVKYAEYYFSKRIWWVFFTAGVSCSVASLFIASTIGSLILGTTGFSLFWSTHEIFRQHKRVLHGQAKRNPRRSYTNESILLLGVCLYKLNYTGIVIGAATCAIIAFSRYACIKGEYYFTKKFWIVFLITGILSVTSSLFISNLVLSAILGINGFSFFWGIGEIIKQEERVKKGWFPKRKSRF